MIDAFVLLMNMPKDFSGPVNLGNPNEFTILELAAIIISMVNSKSEIVFRPLPSDDPMQRKPDISLAKEKMSWNPETSLKDGLKHTIDYFETLFSNG
jgi:UDP-glucuronate decarboxylase